MKSKMTTLELLIEQTLAMVERVEKINDEARRLIEADKNRIEINLPNR